MTVIIDARFSSRQEIIKDLKSSGLFEVTTEAMSLDDGIRILSGHEVDACLLGPSVSPKRAEDFIRRSRESVFSPDCAFIAIIPQTSDNEEELIACGAHGVIRFPCAKQTFTEAMVRAVVKANSNSTWANILQDADERGIDMFTTGKTEGAGEPEKKDKKILVDLTLERLISNPSLEVSTAVEAIKSGKFGFDANGRPSGDTIQAVADLAAIALRGNHGNRQAAGFSAFLHGTLLDWVVDLRSLPDREATEKLNRRIASFVRSQKN